MSSEEEEKVDDQDRDRDDDKENTATSPFKGGAPPTPAEDGGGGPPSAKRVCFTSISTPKMTSSPLMNWRMRSLAPLPETPEMRQSETMQTVGSTPPVVNSTPLRTPKRTRKSETDATGRQCNRQ